MVRLYYEGSFGSDEVGLPIVYRFDYSEEFKVVGVIVLFSGRESGQVVGYWMMLPQCGWLSSFILGEDGSYPIFRCISLEVECLAEVRLPQDWFANHFISEFFKGLLLPILPVLRCGLFSEV